MVDRLFEEKQVRRNGPVECLGISFESDAVRREYFLERLREKLKDPKFRRTEGFPKGSDEDILALSDPPYYTAASQKITSPEHSAQTNTSDQTV